MARSRYTEYSYSILRFDGLQAIWIGEREFDLEQYLIGQAL
jgi:hypothetical protein